MIKRAIARTVLLVGEGYAEEYFLRHLKALYVTRGSGVMVTIKNARGKGAAHVVDYAIRQSNNAAFDVKVALFDTDTDWSSRTAEIAKRGKIQTLLAEPCLEATLLAIHRHSSNGRTSTQLKNDFERRFEYPASDPRVYEKHFGFDRISTERARIPVLETIIQLMTTGTSKT